MTLLYEKNKKNIYKWRQNHKDTYNTKNKKYMDRYTNWKKIQQEFLNILLE